MATSSQYGAFIPTNYIWDIQQLQQMDLKPELKELLVRLYQNINNIAFAVNISDKGFYELSEFVNGQLYFINPNNNSSTTAAANPAQRQVLRKVVNFGALLDTAAKAVPHLIVCTNATTFTRIYATASDTTGHNYIPIPYASPTLANNIELSVDGTNVTITTGSNRSNFNVCYVVLEYIQT